MRAKFGGDPTAGSKNLPFKFNNRKLLFIITYVKICPRFVIQILVAMETVT